MITRAASRISTSLDLDHAPVGTGLAWAVFVVAAIVLTWCS
jgi:hypothetical protein